MRYLILALLFAFGCNHQPKAIAAEPAERAALEEAPGDSPTAPNEEVSVAENHVIAARFREAIDLMPRDVAFETAGRADIAQLWPESRLDSVRCGPTACYVTIASPSMTHLLGVQPETLQWGTHAFVMPDHASLSIFAVLSRGDDDLPGIDTAPE